MAGKSLKGFGKAEHTPRSGHSGAEVDSRTQKGQKRRAKKCKWLNNNRELKNRNKRMEGCRCDEREHCNGSCTGRLGSRGGKKAASEKGDVLLAPLQQHF